MATVAVDAKIFPTVNEVGDEDQGYYTEQNVTKLITYLTRSCVLEGPYISPGSDVAHVKVGGKFIFNGYLVDINPNDTDIELDPLPETINYIYIGLAKDGLGNVTGAKVITSTSGTLAIEMLIGRVVYDSLGDSTIELSWDYDNPAGGIDAKGAEIPPMPRKIGYKYYFADVTPPDQVYTVKTALHLLNIKPAETQLYIYNAPLFVEMDTHIDLLSLTVPRGGRYRVKLTLTNATGEGEVTITSALTGITATALIDSGATAVTFSGPYTIAGDTMTLSAKVTSVDNPREITSVALCGEVVVPPSSVAAS